MVFCGSRYAGFKAQTSVVGSDNKYLPLFERVTMAAGITSFIPNREVKPASAVVLRGRLRESRSCPFFMLGALGFALSAFSTPACKQFSRQHVSISAYSCLSADY